MNRSTARTAGTDFASRVVGLGLPGTRGGEGFRVSCRNPSPAIPSPRAGAAEVLKPLPRRRSQGRSPRAWRNGRRMGLKLPGAAARAGSSPAARTRCRRPGLAPGLPPAGIFSQGRIAPGGGPGLCAAAVRARERRNGVAGVSTRRRNEKTPPGRARRGKSRPVTAGTAARDTGETRDQRASASSARICWRRMSIGIICPSRRKCQ